MALTVHEICPCGSDVYVATSEPHGQISCTVSAKHGFAPLAKL